MNGTYIVITLPLYGEAHIQIWDGWGHPTNVTFKSNKDNAAMDIPYLKKIMATTEEHYIDGKPLHYQERQMQVAHKKTVDDPESMLVKGTFQDLIDVANENYTAVFNVLDIPIGDSSGVNIPPSYLHITSEEYVLNPTKAMVGATDFR
ncbi:hypothetical protein FIBSPDRAFT_900792 [Athelia psychrophila]|uniref:Uncharacterized protein n=1 Tax=Athelia psychrophila TaxID=1759441 RepID=A0A165Y0H0_9AGAM|nr:hypothetical protein FIBSPDRAFT_900792 [Fibularhizoctonia sp. CBS 109695]